MDLTRLTMAALFIIKLVNFFSLKVNVSFFTSFLSKKRISENLWRLCNGCDYSVGGSNIGDIRSISSSLMIPRLIFQEWEGMDSIAGWSLSRNYKFSHFSHFR